MSNRFGITKSQICMVGDRLDTDILFGQNGGCKTLLVLSGELVYLQQFQYVLCDKIHLFILIYRCNKFVYASKSKQLHTTRFLHQQDFRFSRSESGNRVSNQACCSITARNFCTCLVQLLLLYFSSRRLEEARSFYEAGKLTKFTSFH